MMDEIAAKMWALGEATMERTGTVSAAVIHTKSGALLVAAGLETRAPRCNVCAAAIVFGRVTIFEGDTEAKTLLLLERNAAGLTRAVVPNGLTLEMLTDYAPRMRVLLDDDRSVDLIELLPEKYVRTAEG